MMTRPWLLADIGGTRTRVGLGGSAGLDHASLRTYKNNAFDTPEDLLRHYLNQIKPLHPPDALCAGVAGPVRGDSAQLTNHSWHLNHANLRQATGADHVTLLNDLQAQGYALNDLDTSSITPLFAGAQAAETATRLVIGLGTGSNIAVVHEIPTGLWVPPSETGHTNLPYAPGRLGQAIDALAKVHPHRPLEAALSGPGLGHMHHALHGTHLSARAIIAQHAADTAEASETMRLFVALLGQVCGDLALAHLPMGGVYFIGGLARALAPFLKPLGFHDRFCAKGPYQPILQDIPVTLITDDTAAVVGCNRYLMQTITQQARD
ncbi:MAG: ROK family protein [Roseovarius sp.]